MDFCIYFPLYIDNARGQIVRTKTGDGGTAGHASLDQEAGARGVQGTRLGAEATYAWADSSLLSFESEMVHEVQISSEMGPVTRRAKVQRIPQETFRVGSTSSDVDR